MNAAAAAQQQGGSCTQRVAGVHVGTRWYSTAPLLLAASRALNV